MDDFKRSHVAFIVIHGIGPACPGDLITAVTAAIHSADLDGVVPSYSITEVHWANINTPASDAGTISRWGYGVAVKTLAISAHFCTSNIGPRARQLFSYLMVVGTSLAAITLPFSLFLLCSKVMVLVATGGHDPLVGWWLCVAAVPMLLALTVFCITPPIVAISAVPRTRFRAAALSIRGIFLSLLGQLGASSAALLVLSDTRRWVIMLLLSCPIVSWLLFAYGHMGRVAATSLTVLCIIFLSAWFFSGIAGRLIIDIFRYIGDIDFREEIQRRFCHEVQESRTGLKCIIAHSLGGVIAIDSLLNSGVWSSNDHVVLITLGTPISRFFQRFFPGLFFPANAFHCFIEIQKRIRSFRWINVYRPLDYVGASLGLPNTHCTSDRPTKQLLQFHTGYWTDKDVAATVAQAYKHQVSSVQHRLPWAGPVDTNVTVQRLHATTMWLKRTILRTALAVVIVCVVAVVPITIHRYRTGMKEVAELAASGIERKCKITCSKRIIGAQGVWTVITDVTYSLINKDGSIEVVVGDSQRFGDDHLFRIDEGRLAKDVLAKGGTLQVLARVDKTSPHRFFIPEYAPTSWKCFVRHMTRDVITILIFGAIVWFLVVVGTTWSLFILGVTGGPVAAEHNNESTDSNASTVGKSDDVLPPA